MSNGSEGIAEYPGRRTGPGTGFTVGNRFVDEAHPGEEFVVGRTTTALGNVDVYDTEGRYHLITRCTIVGGPVEPGRPDYTALIARVRDYYTCADALHRDLADAVEQLTTDLDKRFEHSDHQSAKYYKRMREAEIRGDSVQAERDKVRAERDALREQLAAAEAVIERVRDLVMNTDGEYLDGSSFDGLAGEIQAAILHPEYRSEGGGRG
jgi:hypothetical protein